MPTTNHQNILVTRSLKYRVHDYIKFEARVHSPALSACSMSVGVNVYCMPSEYSADSQLHWIARRSWHTRASDTRLFGFPTRSNAINRKSTAPRGCVLRCNLRPLHGGTLRKQPDEQQQQQCRQRAQTNTRHVHWHVHPNATTMDMYRPPAARVIAFAAFERLLVLQQMSVLDSDHVERFECAECLGLISCILGLWEVAILTLKIWNITNFIILNWFGLILTQTRTNWTFSIWKRIQTTSRQFYLILIYCHYFDVNGWFITHIKSSLYWNDDFDDLVIMFARTNQ